MAKSLEFEWIEEISQGRKSNQKEKVRKAVRAHNQTRGHDLKIRKEATLYQKTSQNKSNRRWKIYGCTQGFIDEMHV